MNWFSFNIEQTQWQNQVRKREMSMNVCAKKVFSLG